MNQPPKRIKREELYEAVWSRTIKTLAEEWNTTYLRLVHACEEMEVPRPSQGHWQLIARGQVMEKEPLPERTRNIPEELVLLPQGVRQKRTVSATGAVDSKRKEVNAPIVERQEVGEKPAATTASSDQSNEFAPSGAAERAVLDIIRQATRIDFWREKISACVRPDGLARWLGLDGEAKVAEGKLVNVMKNVRKEYQSFRVSVGDTRDQWDQSSVRLLIEICLREGHEWKDAWEEAWTFAEYPNPHCLSDNALRLYQWAKGPKNTGNMTDRRKIGAQARLRKTYDNIEDHLREIRLKADRGIQWEEDTRSWHGQMRIWFQKKQMVFHHHGPLNPALGLNLREWGHAELERFRKWLYEEDLRNDEYLLGMTPPVEEHLEQGIGIEAKLGEENVNAYTELLAEEINEKTEFSLRVIGWHHYSKELTRVLVKKSPADLEGVVRAVQVFGLSKNRLLDGDRVRAMINGLIG